MDTDLLLAVAIGLAAGFLSGQFGIGGGVITTPAIRLLLGRPELIAVGTPLLVILPTALAGAVSYARRGMIDLRAGLVAGAVGAGFSVLGAWATRLAGGTAVLLVTAAIIVWTAVDMALLALGRRASLEPPPHHHARARSFLPLAGLGALTGLYSGFLGLGGGFIVVPVLVRHFGFPMKRAVGTSLVVVSVLAVPGSIAHFVLGHIDIGLAAALALGVVPGALLGAHVTAMAQERTVKLAFAVMLVLVGAVLALTESGLV